MTDIDVMDERCVESCSIPEVDRKIYNIYLNISTPSKSLFLTPFLCPCILLE